MPVILNHSAKGSELPQAGRELDAKSKMLPLPTTGLFQTKLCDPVELAKIASPLLGPEAEPYEFEFQYAVQKAVLLYLHAADFYWKHKDLDVVALAEKAQETEGHFRVRAIEERSRNMLPQPKVYPATFEEFLRLVVRARRLDDAERQFRHCLVDGKRKRGMSEEEALGSAAKTIAFLKEPGSLVEGTWGLYGTIFYYWHKRTISRLAREKARKGVEKRKANRRGLAKQKKVSLKPSKLGS